MTTSDEAPGHFCMKRRICDYNSADDKAVLLNGETEQADWAKNSANGTTKHDSAAVQEEPSSLSCDDNGISNKIATLCKCVYCGCSDQLPHAVKVLPCLHAICRGCLQECVQSDSMPGSQCIFSCPMCSFKVQIPKNGITGLKNLPLSLFNHDISANQDIDEILLSVSSSGKIPLSTSAYPGLNMCCPNVIDDNDKVDIANVLHCNSCDSLVCKMCLKETHSEHSSVQLSEMLQSKADYIKELLEQVHCKIGRHQQKICLLGTCKENIAKLQEELKNDVEERAEYLIQMIQKRKQNVLIELNQVQKQYVEKYEQSTIKLTKEELTMQNSYDFAAHVSATTFDEDILNFHNDITNRLLQLVHQIDEASVEILNLKLDIPEKGREESHMEKMFGSLMQGNVSCGNADLITSFTIDLQWPSSLAATAFNTFVVAGKTGAFESEGKLFYYDRHGNLLQRHEFEEGRIPNDVICAPNGCLWVTDNLGQISKFSSTGVLLETWQNKFKGGGHLALTTQHELMVSSIEDKCVIKYDDRGNFKQRIPSSNVYSLIPHCIASNQNNDVIIADHQAGAVFVFDNKGDIQFKFGGNDGDGAILKCPSDVCSDPFNNILVADFTGDRVVIISKTGEFLGYLLTKENGISCPNFITLDHEGHLFVGQYGGDIHVFSYLSCIKNA